MSEADGEVAAAVQMRGWMGFASSGCLFSSLSVAAQRQIGQTCLSILAHIMCFVPLTEYMFLSRVTLCRNAAAAQKRKGWIL